MSFTRQERRRREVVSEDGGGSHRQGQLIGDRGLLLLLLVVGAGEVGEVGLLVPGDARLVHAVQVLVQLVPVEEDDFQADLASRRANNHIK